MSPKIRSVLFFFALFVFAENANAQVNEICASSGITPSLDLPFAQVPYVYGKIILRGFDTVKLPKVTIYLSEGRQRERWSVDKTGNYCFRRRTTNSGTLIVEIDGIEAAQRTLAVFGAAQQREDFEIFSTQSQKSPPPGVVSLSLIHI